MESFYGGRQGASIVITKRFDVIDRMAEASSDIKKYKFCYCLAKNINGEYVYIIRNNEPICRDKNNWNNYPKYKWILTPKNTKIKHTTAYRSDGDYSNVISFDDKALFSKDELAESMLDCFELGNNSTDIVNYGEYVIINSPIINHPDNGKIFRRGLDHDNDMYGAEYIGQIVGPQGESPEINIESYSEITNPQGFNEKSGSIEMASGQSLDEIQYKYVTVKDEFGNVVGCNIGFKFPQFELEVEGQSISPYENWATQDPNQNGIYNYKNLVVPDSSAYIDNKWTHPFYQKWNIKIPKGIHGKDVENIDIVYTKAKKDAPYYDTESPSPNDNPQYLGQEVDILCDDLDSEYSEPHIDIYKLYNNETMCKIELNNAPYYVPIEFCYKPYLRYKKKSYNKSADGTITYHKICDCNLKPNASDTIITYYDSENNLISNNLQSYLNELKNSVSDGKASLASAITDKGVSTSASDSFQTMAGNIGRIFDANPGSISSSVNVSAPATPTSTVNISAPISISTAGYHSSLEGTRIEGNATAYLTRNGNKIYLSSTSDRSSGNKDYGVYTVPTLWNMFYSGGLAVNNSTTQAWTDKDGNNHSGEKYIYMKYDKAGYINDTNWWIGRPASDFGNAAKTEVISGKTFTSAAGLKVTGTYTVPTETETITAGISSKTVTPTSGKYFSSVTVQPTPSETKSASPSTSAQTISPTSGKLLSSVSISAISPQRTNGGAATTSGRDGNGAFVYFPYGWYPNDGNNRGLVRMTDAQAKSTCSTQTKTSAYPSMRETKSVSPDTNKLLSSVTVPTYRNYGQDPWMITGDGTGGDNGAGNNTYGMGDSRYYRISGPNKVCYFNNPYYPAETSDLLLLFLHINTIQGKVYFAINPDFNKASKSTDYSYKYTYFEYNSSYKEFIGYLLIPSFTTYASGIENRGGKDWYGSGGSVNELFYLTVFTDEGFNGTVDIYGTGVRMP